MQIVEVGCTEWTTDFAVWAAAMLSVADAFGLTANGTGSQCSAASIHTPQTPPVNLATLATLATPANPTTPNPLLDGMRQQSWPDGAACIA